MQIRVNQNDRRETWQGFGDGLSQASQTRVLDANCSLDLDQRWAPGQQERKPATFPGEDRNRVERQYLRFAGVGVQFTLTILLLTLFGIWLDGRFGKGPLFTVVFLLLGFAGATWSLIQQVLGPDKQDKPNKPDTTA
jgi:F0F1-type ATP synthase assembly protein I